MKGVKMKRKSLQNATMPKGLPVSRKNFSRKNINGVRKVLA